MRRIMGSAGANAVGGGDDQYFCSVERVDFVRVAGAIRGRPRRLFLPRDRPGASQIPDPGASIVALTLWASVLVVVFGGFRELFTYVIFASWILYGMTTLAVIVLRIKRPELPRPYRTLGYPFVPVVFVFVSLLLVIATAIDSPWESVKGLVVIGAGLPFYFYWKKRRVAREP